MTTATAARTLPDEVVRLIRSFAPHVPPCQQAQFVMDERY